MRIKFTDLAIRSLPFADTKQVKYTDESLAGFGLIVGKRSKSFSVMYGKERTVKIIGKYPQISLSDARKEAKRLLVQTPDKNAAMRLVEAVSAYLDECEGKNRPNTVREYRRYLTTLTDRKLSEVKKTDIDTSNAHMVMAWRVFFNWCLRSELVDKNPFAYIPTQYNKRSRILSDDELKSLWHYEHGVFSDIVKLLILTGQRRTQYGAFDPAWLSDGTITFPATIMKSKREHQIPVSDLAIQYIPTTTFSGWSKAKKRIDTHTGVSNWTLHDLRRTFSTIHARIGTPVHVTEAYLDHSSGTISGVAAVYNRYNYLAEMKQACIVFDDEIRRITGA